MFIGSTYFKTLRLGASPPYRIIYIAPSALASLLIQFEDQTGGTLPHRIYLDSFLATTLPAGTTEYTITGLEWNTEYTVGVTSFDDPDESSVLSVDIWTSPENPPSLSATATGENSIALTVIPPVTPPASPLSGTGYSIEQSPNGSTGWTVIQLVALSAQPTEVTGLSGSSTYYFRSRSVNKNPYPHDSGYSRYSAIVNATTNADVTGPTLSAVSAVAGDTVADLVATSSETGTIYWYVSLSAIPPATVEDLAANTPNAVYYLSGACIAATPTSQQATGLTNGVTYYLHTVAKDSFNNYSSITTTAGFTPVASIATSYSNVGGSGNRTGDGSIAITYSPANLIVGTISQMYNGITNSGTNYFNSRTIAGTEWIRFDFGTPRFINEAKFYQETTANQGTWKWQVSSDGTNFTDLVDGSSNPITDALGGAIVDTLTGLANQTNTTAYRYWRMLAVSGSLISAPDIYEFEFKID